MLNELYHSLNPVAISIGPVHIYWYALAYLAGFVLAGIVIYRVSRRWDLDITGDEVANIIVAMAWGIIIGARLFYVLFYGDGYYFANPLKIFALNEGGMSFHGGLVGAIVGGSRMCRSCHLSVPTVCDLGASPRISLGAWSSRRAALSRAIPVSCTRLFSRVSSSSACCG